MKIGELAKHSQCKIETIRYYERIGLLPPPQRSDNGYRVYQSQHAKRLSFIRRCRELGFSIEEIRALLELVDGGVYQCQDIKSLTLQHAANIRAKIADLSKLEKTLSAIAAQCHDGNSPDCPIIDALFDPSFR